MLMCPGELVQGPRQYAGLTQRQLAALAKVPQPSIAELESGAEDNPTFGLLSRLLARCGAQLVAVPSTTPSIAATAAELRRAVRSRDDGLVYRLLIQANDDLAAESPVIRLALAVTPPPRTGDRGVDAFLAAVVDHRLRQGRVPRPDWVDDPTRVCDPPWNVAGIDGLVDEIEAHTPRSFRVRGVLIHEDDLASV